jgi:arsenate reductase
MSHIIIYHNPQCGTSRNTLALIREAGHEPNVIEYLESGWNKAQLKDLLKKANLSAKDILRVRGTKAEELGLIANDVAEEAVIDAMVKDPILVNRPIVVTPKGVKLCRPPEEVKSLL